MALISFKEWRGQRNGSNQGKDRGKNGFVGGNPRFGKQVGNDNYANKNNTRAALKRQDKKLDNELEN